MSSSDYFFKLIMLGCSGVGKTCIVQRYCNDVFEGPAHKTTLGFDFLGKKLEHNGKRVDLEVWDTAGQEQYKAVAKMYYKEVHGVLLVYDTTDRTSFDRLSFWLDDLDMNGNKMEQRILVGSKMDLIDKRDVQKFDAKKFASERHLEWMECSAKTGECVHDVFRLLLDKIIQNYDANEDFRRIYGRSTVVSVGPPISSADAAHRENPYKLNTVKKKKKKSGCC
jgi:small GTP-binding protein